jgi:hypothetical protein
LYDNDEVLLTKNARFINHKIWQAFNVKRSNHKAESFGMADNLIRKALLKVLTDGLTAIFPSVDSCVHLSRNSYNNKEFIDAYSVKFHNFLFSGKSYPIVKYDMNAMDISQDFPLLCDEKDGYEVNEIAITVGGK